MMGEEMVLYCYYIRDFSLTPPLAQHIKLNCHRSDISRTHSATPYLQAGNASPLASYDPGYPLGSLTSDTGGSQALNIEYNGDTHPIF